MTDHTADPGSYLYLCRACWQVFSSYDSWEEHANGPFMDVMEAEKSLQVLDHGEAIPAGVRAGVRKCTHPGEEIDPAEWTDIERGDLVYDNNQERAIGMVGHRDDASVDVELWDGKNRTISREQFVPNERFRAIRL